MKLDLPDKDWKAKAPEDFVAHEHYKMVKKLLAKCKDPESMDNPKDLQDATDTAVNIGGLLKKIFDLVRKAIPEANDRKPYNMLQSSWQQRINEYTEECGKRRQVLEDAPKKNSELIFNETGVVFKSVEAECGQMVKQSEQIYKDVKARLKDIEEHLDSLSEGAENGPATLKEMNRLHVESKTKLTMTNNLVMKVEKTVQSEWEPMYKDLAGLTSAHLKQVQKMNDTVRRHVTQITKNESEIGKVINQSKQTILQGGAIFQGQIKGKEAALSKLRRVVTSLEESLSECERTSAYDASGRIDSCEGDLNKLEGNAPEEEKQRVRGGLDQLLQNTRYSLDVFTQTLKDIKTQFDQTMSTSNRGGIDQSDPEYKQLMSDLRKRLTFLVELRKNEAKLRAKLLKVQERVNRLPPI